MSRSGGWDLQACARTPDRVGTQTMRSVVAEHPLGSLSSHVRLSRSLSRIRRAGDRSSAIQLSDPLRG